VRQQLDGRSRQNWRESIIGCAGKYTSTIGAETKTQKTASSGSKRLISEGRRGCESLWRKRTLPGVIAVGNTCSDASSLCNAQPSGSGTKEANLPRTKEPEASVRACGRQAASRVRTARKAESVRATAPARKISGGSMKGRIIRVCGGKTHRNEMEPQMNADGR